MARFLFPFVLLAIGGFGLVEHDAINQQWSVMSPEDPALQTALSHCTQDNILFNRFSAAARSTCYQKYLQQETPTTAPAPGIAVGIPGAPPTHVVPRAPTVHTNH